MVHLSVKIIGALAGLAVVCLVITFIAIWDHSSCSLEFAGVKDHLSTRTPYVQPLDTDFEEDELKLNKSDCQVRQIWLIARHGTRNPSSATILKMKKDLPELQAEILQNDDSNGLCPLAFSRLEKWRIPSDLNETEDEFLKSQGEIELKGLAARFKKRFPELFNHKYDNATFKFKFTKTQRTEASAKAFASGIFEGDEQKRVWYPEPDIADPVLRFYKGCRKWKKQIDNNPESLKEQTLFEGSDDFQSTLSNVQERLGLKRKLTTEDLILMYETCGYETAWDAQVGKISPWCGVFEEKDIRVLEYYEDLEFYWRDGYGYEISYKQACPPIKNLVEAFQNRIDHPENSPNVIAYFSHSGALLKIQARLGLFKDDLPLRGDNFAAQSNRKWQTSQMDKFATNLAFVLHKCEDDHLISAISQEQPIRIPACNNAYHCKFSEFKANMSKIVDECDTRRLCAL